MPELVDVKSNYCLLILKALAIVCICQQKERRPKSSPTLSIAEIVGEVGARSFISPWEIPSFREKVDRYSGENFLL